MGPICSSWISDISPGVYLAFIAGPGSIIPCHLCTQICVLIKWLSCLAQFLVYFDVHVWNLFIVVVSLYLPFLFAVNFNLEYYIFLYLSWTYVVPPCLLHR